MAELDTKQAQGPGNAMEEELKRHGDDLLKLSNTTNLVVLVLLLMVVGLLFQVDQMSSEANRYKEMKLDDVSKKIDDLNQSLAKLQK